MTDTFKYKPWGEKTLVHEILKDSTHPRAVSGDHLRKSRRQYVVHEWCLSSLWGQRSDRRDRMG